jgi:hypothetical protein
MFPDEGGGGYANFFMVKRTIYTNIFYILKRYEQQKKLLLHLEEHEKISRLAV